MNENTKLPPKVQQLIDRAEILDCLNRYARGMDRLDRALVRSAYHDDAVDVHGPIFAGNVEEFIDFAFAYHAGQKFHQHYISNHTIEIDGDTAHSECYFYFVGVYPDLDKRLFSAGGRYIDRMERRDGEWRIVTRVCSAEWVAETEVMEIIPLPVASPALRDRVAITRTREDASYIRPLMARLAPPT
jgi:hypothetical protein